MSAFSLKNEPFPEAGGDDFYFSTPALAARREELCSAVERGHVLLIDQKASGKSTMLDDFAEVACERWRIFRLQAHQCMSAKEFVHGLVSVFGLPTREPAAAELRDADALFELFTARSQLAVIVIDDAQCLQPDALNQLLYLTKRWQKYNIRFLVCAEPDLMTQLESSQDGEYFPGGVSTFDMPRFDHEQVSDYLHLCLFRAGLVGDSPFDPAVVAMVTEKADGLVGAIDPIARELLNSPATQEGCRDRARRGHREKTLARRWPVAVVAAAGLGVLLTVMITGTSTTRTKVESNRHLEGFRSGVTLAPRGLEGRSRERSASADTLTP